MRKFTKGFCRFASIMIAFGIVMLIVGFCMGGRPQGLSIDWNNGPVLRRTPMTTSTSYSGSLVTTTPGNADTIRELELDIGAANVEIRTGSAFSLDVTEGLEYTSSVEDGIWVISNDGERINMNLFGSNNEPRFVVTVPENKTFENFVLDVGAGTMEATGLRAAEAYLSIGVGTAKLSDFQVTGNTDIDVGMGTLNLNGALKGYTYINCGMGTAKLTLERPADYGYTIKCGMGSVRIDGRGTGGIGSEISNNTEAATVYDVDCGMGSVKIEFNDGDATAATESSAFDAPEAPEAPEAPAAPKAPEPPAAPKAPEAIETP